MLSSVFIARTETNYSEHANNEKKKPLCLNPTGKSKSLCNLFEKKPLAWIKLSWSPWHILSISSIMKWGASLINTVPETLRYAKPGNRVAFHHLKKQKLLSIVVTVQNRRFLAATAIFVVNPHPKIFCTKICKGERNANFKNAQFIIFP